MGSNSCAYPWERADIGLRKGWKHFRQANQHHISDRAIEKGATGSVIGMSYRSRLNDMLRVVGRTAEEIFAETLSTVLDNYSTAEEILCAQEEPDNLAALAFVIPNITRLAGGRPVCSVKRSASASPATGYAKAHKIGQKALLSIAFAAAIP